MTWLTDLLGRVRAEDMCVDYRCSTCGAGPFRYALMFAAMRASGDVVAYPGYALARLAFIADALADLPEIAPDDEPAVRKIIHTLWRASDAEAFAGLAAMVRRSPAGAVLSAMQRHDGELGARRSADSARFVGIDAERHAAIAAQRAARAHAARQRWPARATTLDPALVAAFAATDFHVFADPPFVLRCGETSLHLAALFEATGSTSAGFITAWNPDGQPAEPEFNAVRAHELRTLVAERAYHCLEGEGRARAGNWPPEPSLLILDISRSDSLHIGRRFGQAAIVWIGADAVPELLLLA